MRRFLAGICCLLMPIAAFAQVRGEVESVGFQNRYRPDCWTPMTVKLIPETGKTDFYQIQVRQEDLDRDRAIFTRTVSVTGNAEGQAPREQRFRVYFIPQPTRDGLPDARDPTMTLRDLNETLVVNLCTEEGKLIARLPVTSTIQNVDPKPGVWDSRRGVRFILAVTEGKSRPIYLDNATATGLLGMMEDVMFVAVRPDDLPENVLGYDAVDAIVWFDADPASLRGGGEDKRRALDAYVQRGGRLVICQNPEWQKTLEFGEMLPVDIKGVEEKRELMPLRALAQPTVTNADAVRVAEPVDPREDPWRRTSGPFRISRAEPRTGAVVDEWVRWDDPNKPASPYIARQRYGLGSVTWVAQDLGDPYITGSARRGWVYVWERVFDWADEPVVLTSKVEPRDVPRWAPGTPLDVAYGLRNAVELGSKTAWLVTLAIVFFIAYWLVSGPGVFAYLVGKRRTQLSWFMFAASALVATALTVLLVKLVLRGPPELKHFTVIRAAPDAPAVAHSRIGLYIPRDGYQELELSETAPNSVTTISAFAEHPAMLTPGGRERQGPEYLIPVVDAAQNEPAKVRVPYSSTLKKLQATWVGEIKGKVEGSAQLVETGWISGQITNGTGKRLRNVYIAFTYPGEGMNGGDWVLYVPSWDDGVTLDLSREFNQGSGESRNIDTIGINNAAPGQNRRVRGRIAQEWARYWHEPLRAKMMETKYDDWGTDPRRSLAMLSFFERLPPVRNTDVTRHDRTELLRRRARELDVSGALAAGALVVLAEADGPLPFPFQVEGDPVGGTGVTLYQFLLPLDRSKLEPMIEAETATTAPADNADETPGAEGLKEN